MYLRARSSGAHPSGRRTLRLNGARIGHRVYVNTLSISDHNLLEFGDNVVIGADVHLCGHTVEGGVVKTGTVRLGHSVTIGLGSMTPSEGFITGRSQSRLQ